MVEDDGPGVTAQGLGDYLPYTDHAGLQAALEDHLGPGHFGIAVKEGHPDLLMLEVLEGPVHERGSVTASKYPLRKLGGLPIVRRYDVPQGVDLFTLAPGEPIEIGIEVFVEKCLEGNLLLEPEAQCFQCLHDVPSLCVELNLSKETGTRGRFEGKDAHCKRQRALPQATRSHLRVNSGTHKESRQTIRQPFQSNTTQCSRVSH